MRLKKFLLVLCVGFLSSGCLATLMSPFSVESPRPRAYQTREVGSIMKEIAPEILKPQLSKQEKIESVAHLGIRAITSLEDSDQVKGVTNIVANAIDGIVESDGSAKLFKAIAEKSIGDIASMPLGEYLAYSQMQGQVVAPEMRKKAYAGITTGLQTGWKMYSGAGGAVGVLSLLGVGASKLRSSKKANKALAYSLKDLQNGERDVVSAIRKGAYKSGINLDKYFKGTENYGV